MSRLSVTNETRLKSILFHVVGKDLKEPKVSTSQGFNRAKVYKK